LCLFSAVAGGRLALTKDACVSRGHAWSETDTTVLRLVLMIVGLAGTVALSVFIGGRRY
jgi:hypothetical protein